MALSQLMVDPCAEVTFYLQGHFNLYPLSPFLSFVMSLWLVLARTCKLSKLLTSDEFACIVKSNRRVVDGTATNNSTKIIPCLE